MHFSYDNENENKVLAPNFSNPLNLENFAKPNGDFNSDVINEYMNQTGTMLYNDDKYEIYGFIYKLDAYELGKPQKRNLKHLERVEILWTDRINRKRFKHKSKKNIDPKDISVFMVPETKVAIDSE